MRILVVADVPSKSLWDYFEPAKLKGIDLILSAGDLPASYLSFLVTFASCPVLYVRGNHDSKYDAAPPEGCICIDDRIYCYQGIRILGLGGSMHYNSPVCQYTEKEMKKRVRKLRFQLLRRKGFDILLTHAPAYGVNDGTDLPHKGFQVFCDLLDRYSPGYMVHGHTHMNYGYRIPRISRYRDTVVVNAYEKYVFEYDDEKLKSSLPV